MIKNRKIENIEDGITQVHKLYLQRGFNITHIHTDCEFKPLRKEMTYLSINLNFASKKEHVPEMERFIRTIKERVRSARSTMPLKRISKPMIVYPVASFIFCLSAFSPSTPGAGLSDTKGPGQLILVNTVDYKRFGPPARIICPGSSRGWTPKHKWYWPDCRRNCPRTSI